MEPTCAWENRVVDVDDRLALAMHHRRELVHPLAIVPFVVRIEVAELPAVIAQLLLHTTEIGARYQQIDICHPTSDSRGQTGGDVSGALEQNPPLAGVEKHAREPVDLPAEGALVVGGQGLRRLQPIVQPWRPVPRNPGAALCDHPTEQTRG